MSHALLIRYKIHFCIFSSQTFNKNYKPNNTISNVQFPDTSQLMSHTDSLPCILTWVEVSQTWVPTHGNVPEYSLGVLRRKRPSGQGRELWTRQLPHQVRQSWERKSDCDSWTATSKVVEAEMRTVLDSEKCSWHLEACMLNLVHFIPAEEVLGFISFAKGFMTIRLLRVTFQKCLTHHHPITRLLSHCLCPDFITYYLHSYNTCAHIMLTLHAAARILFLKCKATRTTALPIGPEVFHKGYQDKT